MSEILNVWAYIWSKSGNLEARLPLLDKCFVDGFPGFMVDLWNFG